MLETLLTALRKDPSDKTGWSALADHLEETGQEERAELTRLTIERKNRHRVQKLLEKGVLPCRPEVVNSLGMRLTLIPAGKFLMGSKTTEKERYDDEHLHQVEITRAYYLGVFPVTQAEYQGVMRKNPSYFSPTGQGWDLVKRKYTKNYPVERVSWHDATEFCHKLSEREGRGTHYRLPTEAEWEYACRAGTSTPFSCGYSLSSKQANFHGSFPGGNAPSDTYLGKTCQVGSYLPNAWGLYDMHGNVAEWCADWYDAEYYYRSPLRNPPGHRGGHSRVIRGGSWNSIGKHCRSSYRYLMSPPSEYTNSSIGFRIVLNTY